MIFVYAPGLWQLLHLLMRDKVFGVFGKFQKVCHCCRKTACEEHSVVTQTYSVKIKFLMFLGMASVKLIDFFVAQVALIPRLHHHKKQTNLFNAKMLLSESQMIS